MSKSGLKGGRLFKAAISALGILAILVSTVVGAPNIAQAVGSNAGIKLGNIEITPADAQLTIGDKVMVEGEWDAKDAMPVPGDTFTIGLPSELGFPTAVPFSLMGPNSDGDVVSWAECMTNLDDGTVTCTMTDAVIDDSEMVHGTFEFEVEALEATDAKELIFDLNGDDTPVKLPGGGGIDDGILPPAPWSKTGAMNSDNWSVGWKIALPGNSMQGNNVINIAEELSSNHKLCEPSGIKITPIRGGQPQNIDVPIEMLPGADPQHFIWMLTEPVSGWDEKTTYEITYDTCTLTGEIDPVGTEYTNEANVDIWGSNGGSGIIGVEREWDFTGTVAKTGSVRGGEARNGIIDWVVEVDGDVVNNNNSFTFADQLEGSHAVCIDTISNIKVYEKYGPSSSRKTEITGQLNMSGVTSAADSFGLTFTFKDAELAFKPHPYVYEIHYQTCVTTDGLPADDTELLNTATVNGTVSNESAAKVPDRYNNKSGSVNGQGVTLDGITYMPQTTIGWNITVPGEKLKTSSEGILTGDLTVTDTLSGPHQVCAAGDPSAGTAKRLGLSVWAIDQIDGGGLAPVDLTDNVTASVSGQVITLSIPEPTLVLPGGGTVTGFSHEYKYEIKYNTCTASGGMDMAGTEYGNRAQLAGQAFNKTVTQTNRGSGTGTGMPRGTVVVNKVLTGAGAEIALTSDQKFTVKAEEFAPGSDLNGEPANTFTLELSSDGTPLSGPNARGHGWKMKLSEPNFPNVPGVTFGDPVFTNAEGTAADAVEIQDGGKVAIATISPNTNIGLVLTNTANLGALSVLKTLAGGAADQVDADKQYQISAVIGAVGDIIEETRNFSVTAGTPYLLDNLPIGATVTFTEAVPAPDDLFTWWPPTINPGSIEVLPEHSITPGVISVTNHVERTVGSFSLTKMVTGAESDNPAVPETVTVMASWAQDGSDFSSQLEIPTDGTPVAFGQNLLIGTEVTLTEVPLADGAGIAWGAPVWAGTGVSLDGGSAVVTIGRHAEAIVTLTNHAATSTAGISFIKGIAGEAAGEVDETTEFDIQVTWVDAEDATQTRDLKINSVTPTELGEELPAGTEVTVTEGDRPEFDTVIWGSITISGDDVTDQGDGSATIIVSDQEADNTLVTVVNEATWAPGTFSITKRVEGVLLSDPDVPETVTVEASWFDRENQPQSKTLEVFTDGTVVDFGDDLPHGTEVTLREILPEANERFQWVAPLWEGDVTVNDLDEVVVTIGAAEVAEVKLINFAEAHLGIIHFTKKLEGSGASEVPADTEFIVNLTWHDLLGEEQALEMLVKAGQTSSVYGLPLGTEVTIVEAAPELPTQLKWESVAWANADEHVVMTPSGKHGVVIVASSEVAHEDADEFTPATEVEMILTNEISKTPDLPATGQSASLSALIAVGAIAVGLGIWLMRRQPKRSA